MAPAPVPTTTMKSMMTLLALSSGLGIPVGVAAKMLQHRMSPLAPVPSATTFTDLPLAPHIGPERKEKVAGIIDNLRGAYHGVVNGMQQLPVAHKLVLGGGGLAAGAGIGYGATNKLTENATNEDLDAQLAEREKMFNDLLLQEQMSAGGYKAADVLDAALETVLDHEMQKSAAQMPAGAVEGAKDAVNWSALVPTLLAMVGAGYGTHKGWSNTVASDRNRAIASALESSLDARLMGNAEGPRAPMIVKVRTDRIGATPVSGGVGRSGDRDVLERL